MSKESQQVPVNGQTAQDQDRVPVNEDSKRNDVERAAEPPGGQYLTTNQGLRISDDQNSLKAGSRGPTLLEDFIFREKITHFDHERIPERVVHARGAGAYGYFQPYESLADLTRAKFLQDPNVRTPVFVRFSTVAGSRGSADTARDVRGFAVKFYTEEGNFDLVGNNIPIFFIQDAIKFPDLIHAAKPEQDNEIPQAATAHNTFWDFVSLTPESTHMLMWIMSDRAIPRSFSRMEGFGIHSFRLVNAEGKSCFVKFHWKPVLGMHSLVWDEAQKLAGKDPDYHRRDLYDSIDMGFYPEWDFGVQVIEEEDQLKYGFDILDATKIIPEEVIPVRRIGKMVLNAKPDNFFAEVEQVAFHPAHIVPGIDFSNDPLLQGRLFSYLDTQLIRVGPNFAELPINRPVAPVHNNQRDAHMRHEVNKGPVAYYPNSLKGGCPMHALHDPTAFRSFAERMEGYKVRERSDSFSDHFSQATLFWNSMSQPEKDHIISAFHFELNKVTVMAVRERMVDLLLQVDTELGTRVAEEIGVDVPAKIKGFKNHGKSSEALSMRNQQNPMTVKGRKVGVLVADGVNGTALNQIKAALANEGVLCELIGRRGGMVKTQEGEELAVSQTALTASSVFYDGVLVPGGSQSVKTLLQMENPPEFVYEAYRHCKPIAAFGEGVELLRKVGIGRNGAEEGVLVADNGTSGYDFAQQLVSALAQHRFFTRVKEQVPV